MKTVLGIGWWFAMLAVGWLVWVYTKVAGFLDTLTSFGTGTEATLLFALGVFAVALPGGVLLFAVVRTWRLGLFKPLRARLYRRWYIWLGALLLALQLGYLNTVITDALEGGYLLHNTAIDLDNISAAIGSGNISLPQLLVPDYSAGYWLAHTADAVAQCLMLLLPAWLAVVALRANRLVP
jgi:hypothetical protein